MRTTKLERTPTFPAGRRTWEWDETLGLGLAGSSLNLSKGWPGIPARCAARDWRQGGVAPGTIVGGGGRVK